MTRLAQVIVCIVLVGFSLISQTLLGKVCKETQLSRNKSRPHDRIAGGSYATEGMFPSFASLSIYNSTRSYEHHCGAVLVSHRQLLTAAHCIIEGFNHFARFKGIEREARNGSPYLIAARVCKHPKYSGPPYYHDDLAVMTLYSDLEFTDNIKPATLCEDCELEWKELAPTVTGLGLTSSEPESKILKYIRMEWVDQFIRHKSAQYLRTTSGSNCQGDSGSPVYAQIDDQQVLVGIVSTVENQNCEASESTTTGVTDLYNKKKEVMDLLDACRV